MDVSAVRMCFTLLTYFIFVFAARPQRICHCADQPLSGEAGWCIQGYWWDMHMFILFQNCFTPVQFWTWLNIPFLTASVTLIGAMSVCLGDLWESLQEVVQRIAASQSAPCSSEWFEVNKNAAKDNISHGFSWNYLQFMCENIFRVKLNPTCVPEAPD